MTLHVHKVDDRTILQDARQPLPVPVGWQIADGSADDARVCGAHPWQSHYLVFANGDAYGTAVCSNPKYIGAALCCGYEMKNIKFCLTHETGKTIFGGHLRQDAQGVSSQDGHCDVLMRRRA
jgi:hypothetical protein